MVARIEAPGGVLELDRRVVEQLAERDDLSEAEARERALDRLRYVAARREELAERQTPPEHPDELDPARREHLERAALVRLWMREVFEPAHTAASIPDRVVAQNMADPSRTRRLFHPELWFICQALIVPSEKDQDGRNRKPPSEGEAAARWQADAGRAFAPLVARVKAVADDLFGSQDCGVLGRIVGASERKLDTDSGALTIRFEAFAMVPDQAEQSFDAVWLEQVTARREPHVVGPFATQFGLHLVVVSSIEPAKLADGSLPPEQLAAAREAELRGHIEEAWRADQLQRTLAEARERRVVRVATELE
ncbi:MAG TPA: hypothetical protein VM869_04345 [Enhygromyxa sp.]|nr:hypothetical protein [Enhygromyxa sp.]